ncbi:CsbD family protein [Paraburkholderia phymatum]|uniref:CsbD family protein n=1 Tax=Paraburkholderia phymatum TaxID=148447 RepID=A0ACC6UCG5_9BURK
MVTTDAMKTNPDEVGGIVHKVVGKVRETAESLVGDPAMELKAKAQHLGGQLQGQATDRLDDIRELATSRPVGSLVVVAAAGFLLGSLWSSRRH